MIKIKEVFIQHFKGIKELQLENLKDINVFIGKNNSGKTSILEALELFFDSNPSASVNKLQNIRHYTQNGEIHEDTKISLVFEVQNAFFELSDTHKTFTQYGNEIQISRIRFEQGQVKESYVIENNQAIKENSNAQNNMQLITEIIQIFGNNKFRYLPAIDGMRSQGNNHNYYKNYYDDSNAVTLRGGIKSIAQDLYNRKNNLPQEHEVPEFFKRRRSFYPEFAELGVVGADQLSTRFGYKENTKTISFYDQGLGEVDTL